MVYRYRPTLLETAVDDSDPETRGWSVIDRPTWARLKELLDLPDTCRLELVNEVWRERASHRRRKKQPQPKPPSESREEIVASHESGRQAFEGLAGNGRWGA